MPPRRDPQVVVPRPVVKSTICSLCGLDWDLHKEQTAVECIRLLRTELARRPYLMGSQALGSSGFNPNQPLTAVPMNINEAS